MTRFDLIWEFQRAIVEIYREYDLTSLRGLKNESLYQVNGRNILAWHSDVTGLAEIDNKGRFNYSKNFDDIIICSDELLYFTAHLYLYRPFINNPLQDAQIVGGNLFYPNHQNIEAKRFNAFANAAGQSAYNYWDRIGDLIASFFPNNIQSHQVFFPKAIDAIPAIFHSNENYQWLRKFKDCEYKELNEMRRQIVHYTTVGTDYNHRHLEVGHNTAAMQLLQNEREKLPDFYRQQIALTFTGFEKTLQFLDDINSVLFSNFE